MTINNMLRIAAITAVMGVWMPAFAGITFTCAPNIDAARAGSCVSLNTTVSSLYAATFTNANASIYIRFGQTGLGASLKFSETVAYSVFYNALQANRSGATDNSAVASLGGGAVNPVDPNFGVAVPSALMTALALGVGTGTDASENACQLGTPGCYDGLILLSDSVPFWYRTGPQPANAFDFFETVQHEVNEVLGTSSCITTIAAAPALSPACTNSGNGLGPADLFRFSAPGVRSFIAQGNGTPAYFSVNGGVTKIAGYNNSPNSEDYGDWDSALLRVQNASGPPGVSAGDFTTDGGSAVFVLDAIGYRLQAVPEPSTAALGCLGLALLTGLARRRKQQR